MHAVSALFLKFPSKDGYTFNLTGYELLIMKLNNLRYKNKKEIRII